MLQPLASPTNSHAVACGPPGACLLVLQEAPPKEGKKGAAKKKK
jgi:hypothetical protein